MAVKTMTVYQLFLKPPDRSGTTSLFSQVLYSYPDTVMTKQPTPELPAFVPSPTMESRGTLPRCIAVANTGDTDV
jgi:hypothetical protein